MVILHVYCQPGARHTQWAGWHDGRPKLRLKAPAVEGAANQALIEFLAQVLDIPKSNVTLVAGPHSRMKRVEIEGVTDAQLLAHLPPAP